VSIKRKQPLRGLRKRGGTKLAGKRFPLLSPQGGTSDRYRWTVRELFPEAKKKKKTEKVALKGGKEGQGFAPCPKQEGNVFQVPSAEGKGEEGEKYNRGHEREEETQETFAWGGKKHWLSL